LLQPRVLARFAHDQLWERLPWALLSLAVVIVGFAAVYFAKLLLKMCCLSAKYREKYVLVKRRGNHKVFVATTRKRWGSVAHLMLETFFFVGVVIVLWIGAHVAGFNFWTSSFVGVGIGLVGTYIFGTALQNIGAGYFVFLTDKIEEGWYIKVAGVEGRVIEIHPLYVEIENHAKSGGALHHQVPMVHILTSVLTRDFNAEYSMRSTTAINPNDHLTGERDAEFEKLVPIPRSKGRRRTKRTI